MKLVSFTARRYRSITKAYKLPLGNLSVLVGPNNEGKSNVLKALVVALGMVSQSELMVAGKSMRYRWSRRRTVFGGPEFDWDRDFPVALQESQPLGRSEFVLEFALTPTEREDVGRKTGANLTSNLKLNLGLGRDDVRVDVLLQGKGKRILVKSLRFLAQFISERVEVQYVPAIRPSEMAVSIVEGLLSKELAILERDPEYQECLRALETLQRPVLDRLGQELTGTVASFIPEVVSIQITSHEQLRRAIRRSCTVMVDDGTQTDLEMKGDGIKSLAALSLVRHTSQSALEGRQLILAVEEPESHLHPKAVHRLRQVIEEIASVHQVILTTHSPMMLNRSSIGANIIVKDRKASPAKKLRDIRDALGVEVSDNLTTAGLILLVEGKADVDVIGAWLRSKSDSVKGALGAGSMAIAPLEGVKNLKYQVTFYHNIVCDVYAFLDSDEPAKQAAEAAIGAGILGENDITQTTVRGLRNAELEDLIVPSVYAQALEDELGITLAPKHMRNGNAPWSERMKANCSAQGKSWTNTLEAKIKYLISREATANGIASLIPEHAGPIDALAKALETRIQKGK